MTAGHSGREIDTGGEGGGIPPGYVKPNDEGRPRQRSERTQASWSMRQEDRGVARPLSLEGRVNAWPQSGPCRLFHVFRREGTKQPLARRGGLTSQGMVEHLYRLRAAGRG
jgi:hypothetical protein